MARQQSLYELLEVSSSATFEEIEQSYQRIAAYLGAESLAVYSILEGDDAASMRSQLDEAYRTLSDPDRRAAYDRARREESNYPSITVPASHRSDASLAHVGSFDAQRKNEGHHSGEGEGDDEHSDAYATDRSDALGGWTGGARRHDHDRSLPAPIRSRTKATRPPLRGPAARTGRVPLYGRDVPVREPRDPADALDVKRDRVPRYGREMPGGHTIEPPRYEARHERTREEPQSDPRDDWRDGEGIDDDWNAADEAREQERLARERDEERRLDEERAEARRAEERRAEERRAEERRADERRAEERRAEERRADERRAEERRADERRAEEARMRAEEARAEERRLEARRADEARARADEQRAEERRAEERRAEEQRRQEHGPSRTELVKTASDVLEPRQKSRVPLPPALSASAKAKRRQLTPSLSIDIGPDTEFGGAMLRRLRESTDASLDEVAEITKVSKRYLVAIETNDFAALPAAVYTRGFVAEYARVLGLDPQMVTKSFMSLYAKYRGVGG